MKWRRTFLSILVVPCIYTAAAVLPHNIEMYCSLGMVERRDELFLYLENCNDTGHWSSLLQVLLSTECPVSLDYENLELTSTVAVNLFKNYFTIPNLHPIIFPLPLLYKNPILMKLAGELIEFYNPGRMDVPKLFPNTSTISVTVALSLVENSQNVSSLKQLLECHRNGIDVMAWPQPLTNKNFMDTFMNAQSKELLLLDSLFWLTVPKDLKDLTKSSKYISIYTILDSLPYTDEIFIELFEKVLKQTSKWGNSLEVLVKMYLKKLIDDPVKLADAHARLFLSASILCFNKYKGDSGPISEKLDPLFANLLQEHSPNHLPTYLMRIILDLLPTFGVSLSVSYSETFKNKFLLNLDELYPEYLGFWGTIDRYTWRWQRYIFKTNTNTLTFPMAIDNLDELVEFWGNFYRLQYAIPTGSLLPHPVILYGVTCTTLSSFLENVTKTLQYSGHMDISPNGFRISGLPSKHEPLAFWRAVARTIAANTINRWSEDYATGFNLDRDTLDDIYLESEYRQGDPMSIVASTLAEARFQQYIPRHVLTSPQ